MGFAPCQNTGKPDPREAIKRSEVAYGKDEGYDTHQQRCYFNRADMADTDTLSYVCRLPLLANRQR